ncbi:putative Lipoprotein [Azospirillaceae bacterium]
MKQREKQKRSIALTALYFLAPISFIAPIRASQAETLTETPRILQGAWSVRCDKGPDARRLFEKDRAIGPGKSSLTVKRSVVSDARIDIFYTDKTGDRFEVVSDTELRYLAQLRQDGSVSKDWTIGKVPILQRCDPRPTEAPKTTPLPVSATGNPSCKNTIKDEKLQTTTPPSVHVSVEPGNGVVGFGEEIIVRWRTSERNKTPGLFDLLVFGMQENIRVAGEGVLISPPRSPLPFGAIHQPDKMRVVAPLYLPNAEERGEFRIRVFTPKNFSLSWATITTDECGRISTTADDGARERSFTVLDQTPIIQVQDRLAATAPRESRTSPSEDWRLDSYDGFFEIIDKRTGGLVFSRAGQALGFSPRSRFLSYRSDNKYSVQVVDLADRRTVAGFVKEGEIFWSSDDAFGAVLHDANGGVGVFAPLLDRKWGVDELTGCHGCRGAETAKILVDSENALVWVGSDFENGFMAAESLLHPLDRHRFLLSGNASSRSVLAANDLIKKLALADENKKFEIEHQLENLYRETIRNPEEMRARGFPVARAPRLMKKVTDSFSRGGLGRLASTSEIKHPPATSIALESEKIVRGTGIPKINGKIIAEKKQAGQISEKVIMRLFDYGFSVFDNSPSIFRRNFVRGNQEYYNKFDKSPAKIIGDGIDVKTSRKENIGIHISDILETCGGKDLKWPVFLEVRGWSRTQDQESYLIKTACDEHAASSASISGELAGVLIKSGRVFNQNFVLDPQRKSGDSEEEDYVDERNRVLKLDEWSDRPSSSRIEAFFSTGDLILIASFGASTIVAVHPETNQILHVIPNAQNISNVDGIYASKDRKHILQVNANGRFFLYRANDAVLVLSGVYLDDEIVLYTQDGFYDGTAEGATYVDWYFPGSREHHDFSQFASRFHRPDIIRAILRGETPTIAKEPILPPPSVEIELTAFNATTLIASAHVSATGARPLKTIRLFVDGAPAGEAPVSGTTANATHPLSLHSGRQWVTAVAYDDRGFSGQPKTALIAVDGPMTRRPRLFGLGVGVNHYPKIPGADLAYAVQDADAFIAAIRANSGGRYKTIDAALLTEDKARNDSIMEALDRMIDQATAEDTIMVYFAGHGVKDGRDEFYFLGYDTDIADPGKTALAWRNVAGVLARSRAKVLVFLDACHSGIASGEKVMPNDAYAAELLRAGKAGMVVLAASKGRQFSEESPRYGGGHGAFNVALTRALTENRQKTDRNQNGVIELDELYGSIRENVRRLTQERQTPWLARNEVIGKMVLF